MTTFLHNGPLGDIIYALPVIKYMGGGRLYLGKREFRDFNQTGEILYQVRQMLSNQDYINDVIPYHEVSRIDFNLDPFRWEAGKFPGKNLVQCYFDALGINHIFNTKTAWFDSEATYAGFDIVISQTTRFHDTEFDFSPLQDYQERCLFIGFPSEYHNFVRQTGLNKISYDDAVLLRDNIFLHTASIIKGAKLFIGNQSFFMALAHAMQVSRVMKVFSAQPNCMFYNDNFHTELTKEIIERYVK